MVKCPFCHFDNEDGALFCEQCKSDLGVDAGHGAGVHSAPMDAPIETIPLAAIEATPVMAASIMESVVETSPATETLHGVVGTEATMEAIPLAETAPILTPEPSAVPVAAVVEAPLAAETAGAGSSASPTSPAVETTSPALGAAQAEAVALPEGAQPRLVVLRGQKRNVEYPIYEGHNFIGRADEKPVDIDLEDQEPPDRVWSSRQHALITFENNALVLEDLNSSNGTFVNRGRI